MEGRGHHFDTMSGRVPLVDKIQEVSEERGQRKARYWGRSWPQSPTWNQGYQIQSPVGRWDYYRPVKRKGTTYRGWRDCHQDTPLELTRLYWHWKVSPSFEWPIFHTIWVFYLHWEDFSQWLHLTWWSPLIFMQVLPPNCPDRHLNVIQEGRDFLNPGPWKLKSLWVNKGLPWRSGTCKE